MDNVSKIKFKKESWATAPTRGHETDAGIDLYAPQAFKVDAHSFSKRIDLGVGFQIPWGYVGYVVERSSQGKEGINVIGPVVDHGYTGNIHATLVNNKDEAHYVEAGDKICQMLLLRIGMKELEEVTEFEKTERGNKSHGSTGK